MTASCRYYVDTEGVGQETLTPVYVCVCVGGCLYVCVCVCVCVCIVVCT